LPEWVFADRFDIQARAAGNPIKAQMRLMVQSVCCSVQAGDSL
jgi:hypothetical protein